MKQIRVDKSHEHEAREKKPPVAHQPVFIISYPQLIERDKKIMCQTKHRHEQIPYRNNKRTASGHLTVREDRQMIKRVRHLIPHHDYPQQNQQPLLDQ